MICKAKRCTCQSMPGFDLCGYHDEMAETGIIVERKPGRGRPMSNLSEEEKKALIRARLDRNRDAHRARQAALKDRIRESVAASIASHPPRCSAYSKTSGPNGLTRCRNFGWMDGLCKIHYEKEHKHDLVSADTKEETHV